MSFVTKFTILVIKFIREIILIFHSISNRNRIVDSLQVTIIQSSTLR